MSRAIYSRWYRGHVCTGFCKSALGTREFCEMAFQKSGNFILEFWWDPWTKLSYIEMVVMTQNKISPGIVINHVDRSFHVLIVTTGDISMIPSFEIWSYMLLELLHRYPVGIFAESNHRNKLWMELKPHSGFPLAIRTIAKRELAWTFAKIEWLIFAGLANVRCPCNNIRILEC